MINKFYKASIIVSLLVLTACSQELQSNVHVDCKNLKACELKVCNLKNDILMAKKANNQDKIKGLEISLNKVEKYCTGSGLIEDVEKKISDVQKDLEEDKADYKEALSENRADKIKKYKNKMAEETQELQELEKELNSLR